MGALRLLHTHHEQGTESPRLLAWLDPPPVYVGGSVVPLFLDDFGRSQTRPTEDGAIVDLMPTDPMAYRDHIVSLAATSMAA